VKICPPPPSFYPRTKTDLDSENLCPCFEQKEKEGRAAMLRIRIYFQPIKSHAAALMYK